MILRNATMAEFMNLTEGKKVVAMPAGGSLQQTLAYEEDSGLADRIAFLVDNDKKKNVSKLRTWCRDFDIRSVDELRKMDTKDLVLLVSHIDAFPAIVAQLDGMPELDNVECYVHQIMKEYEVKESVVTYGTHQQIPKKIHYIWFGGELSELSKKCIASWERNCPDYEIIRWDESNYDIDAIPFIKTMYRMKMYGAASYGARLDIIHKHGGIYLDTDIEMLKNFDPLLTHEGFCSFSINGLLDSGRGFGAVAGSNIMKECVDFLGYYDYKVTANNAGRFADALTAVMRRRGLNNNGKFQILDGMAVFPRQYFDPKGRFGSDVRSADTYSVHHEALSWDNNETGSTKYAMENLASSACIIAMRMGLNQIERSTHL